jgi:hypothetical protein
MPRVSPARWEAGCPPPGPAGTSPVSRPARTARGFAPAQTRRDALLEDVAMAPSVLAELFSIGRSTVYRALERDRRRTITD